MFMRNFFKTNQPYGAPQMEELTPMEMEEALYSEMEEIRRLDPSIRTVHDLLRMPSAQLFRMYVKRGNSFVEAYILANRRELLGQTGVYGQQTGGSVYGGSVYGGRGKEHLSATTSHMAPMMAEVPYEEMELFRSLLPELPDSAFRAYCRKNKM